MNTAEWNADYLIINDFTFLEITNSGKFASFRNEKIKEGISDYYKTYEFSSTHISEMTQSGLTVLLDVMPELSRYYNQHICILFSTISQYIS